MQAGLSRFGTDFGNGQADQLFFPREPSALQLVERKAKVLCAHPERSAASVQSPDDGHTLMAARAWLVSTLQREGHAIDPRRTLDQLGAQIAEDFVIVRAPRGSSDRALFVHVCFPSGWRPEHLLGQSFLQIHARVPAFGAVERKAESLVEGMVTRGPYVRFVWTITADDELDHHPEQGRRAAWSQQTRRGFLRVERQITVPFPQQRASIFLIRTYLYDFDELSNEQRRVLRRALELMPDELLRYKHLEAAAPRAIELLGAAPRMEGQVETQTALFERSK